MKRIRLLPLLFSLSLSVAYGAKSKDANHQDKAKKDDQFALIMYEDTFLKEHTYFICHEVHLKEVGLKQLKDYKLRHGYNELYFFSEDGWSQNPNDAILYSEKLLKKLIARDDAKSYFKARSFWNRFIQEVFEQGEGSPYFLSNKYAPPSKQHS